MATLDAAQRKKLPNSDFALPATRQYPIDTIERARLAVAMVGKYDPSKKAQVIAAVKKRYPSIDVGGG